MRVEVSKASTRNTQSYWVRVNGVLILFSYETAVAFQYNGQRYRRNNDWGPTTGRHMSESGVRSWTVLEDSVKFREKLDEALVSSFVDAVESRLNQPNQPN